MRDRVTRDQQPVRRAGRASHPTAKRVRAEVVGERRSLASLRRRERIQNTFWLIPALFLVGALLLAVVTRAVDENLAAATSLARPWIVSARDASVVLATLATAMLTFLGVVFSIGLVALQLASQQFSPRVLRTYVRSTTTKVALGTFIATFIYPLFSLGYIEELIRTGRPFVTVSVAVAMILAVASIAVFIAYVTLTIRGMRIAYAISTVAIETRKALLRQFPDATHYVLARPSRARPAGRWFVDYHKPRFTPRHRAQGVLQAVDVARCVSLARRYDVVLRLVPYIGQYVADGDHVFEVSPASAPAAGSADRPAEKSLLSAVDVGPERAVYLDPFYGVRALVDVAAQALSPAVNAPTTAVQVLDRLQDFLALTSGRPWPSGFVADDSGAVRLVMPVRSWDQLVDLALTEITEFGAGSPQVTRRLASLLETLLLTVPSERRPVLQRHQVLLAEAVDLRLESYRDLAQVALQPDVRGLG
jgi:uncharacterized membrane protein